VGKRKLTKNDAKCSDVMTALNPTTGTNAANNVPKTTCIEKAIIWTRTKRIHLWIEENFPSDITSISSKGDHWENLWSAAVILVVQTAMD